MGRPLLPFILPLFMTLPFKPALPGRSPRPAAESEVETPVRQGSSPALRIALFLGVFYLCVWPALALYLVSLAVRGLCLLPGLGECAAWLGLESALPAWAARLLALGVMLAFALSFLLRLRQGSLGWLLLWVARGTVVLAPAGIGLWAASVPMPFPVAWAVGLIDPRYLGFSLRLLGASLGLAWLLALPLWYWGAWRVKAGKRARARVKG